MPTKSQANCKKQSLIYWPAVAVAAAFTVILVGGLSVWALCQPRPSAGKAQEMPVRSAIAQASEREVSADRPAAVALPAVAPAAKEAPAAPPAPSEPAAPLAGGEVCPVDIDAPLSGTPQNYGTSVSFLGTPVEAARQAKREQKLMLVLHVAGNFEDSCFT